MIKLKDLLKESSPGFTNRKFGDPLPTLKDIAKKHQGKEIQKLNEASLPKLQVPSDVSYYNRDWEPVLKSWGDIDFGPRESEMYDWNVRQNYSAAVKEYNAHMAKVAAKLNANIKNLEGAGDKWRKIIEKHRKKDRS